MPPSRCVSYASRSDRSDAREAERVKTKHDDAARAAVQAQTAERTADEELKKTEKANARLCKNSWRNSRAAWRRSRRNVPTTSRGEIWSWRVSRHTCKGSSVATRRPSAPRASR